MEKIHHIQQKTVEYILAELINEIDDWLVIYDAKGRIIYANRQVERLSGYTNEEILSSLSMVAPWENNRYNRTIRERALLRLREDRKFDTIALYRRKNGTEFYLSLTLSGIKDSNGEVVNYICIGKDITDAKILHEKLHRIKYLDEVTGLPNQAAFVEMVYNKVSQQDGSNFAVILVDINKMSYINNTYGLETGDALIKEIGSKIQSIIGTNCTIAKLHVDVFAIVYEELESSAEVVELLETIFKEFKKPIVVDEHELYIEMAAGISIYPHHATKAGKIINKVQIALARAKEDAGKNKFVFYEDYIQDEVQARMFLENDMHQAYRNNEFIVYYQPFIDLQRDTLTGMEALLRRKKRSGEIVLPGKFIDLLEQMELIEQVGVQVIEAVCKQLREWIDGGYMIVPVSINLSTLQFKNTRLAKDIISLLEKYDIPPELIVLEITESVVMQNVETAQATIEELRKYGFKIAIDDFGTGYSSLGYLKKFLFDHLKIDISFIKEIAQNPQDRAIVGAIISIAKALSLQTIAEGIETTEQLKIIQEMGCEIGQGYFWDQPLDAKSIQEKYLLKLYKEIEI